MLNKRVLGRSVNWRSHLTSRLSTTDMRSVSACMFHSVSKLSSLKNKQVICMFSVLTENKYTSNSSGKMYTAMGDLPVLSPLALSLWLSLFWLQVQSYLAHLQQFHPYSLHTIVCNFHLITLHRSNHTTMWLRSVRVRHFPSLDLGQNLQKDENGNGTMGCGSGWGCHGGWFGVWAEGKWETQKHPFGGPRRYVYYFKDICQGTLQSG